MPKVKIVSGNMAGAVVEMPQAEAEAAFATGFGEPVAEKGKPKPKVEPKLEPPPEPRRGRRR